MDSWHATFLGLRRLPRELKAFRALVRVSRCRRGVFRFPIERYADKIPPSVAEKAMARASCIATTGPGYCGSAGSERPVQSATCAGTPQRSPDICPPAAARDCMEDEGTPTPAPHHRVILCFMRGLFKKAC
jgi:hypothetical protein